MEAFLRGNLSILLILLMLAAGAVAFIVTPGEEEPQIVAPMADIVVRRLGSNCSEVLTFAGAALPMDFNRLVQHYYLRRESHQGDSRVNLLPREDRAEKSHALILRLRIQLEEVARRHRARVKLIEVPAGPPVLSTLVAGSEVVGGHLDAVYFTATAMIGMIALAGIADRNAILLLDFNKSVRERGISLKEALIESGAVRFRPILLTAGEAMLDAWPITLDPVFSGIAWL